ncbi:MAG TPA: hypothetical protein VM285_08045 [Polyangia bacterium]|nr:hypothetical protein [Polyangia bacterium]
MNTGVGKSVAMPPQIDDDQRAPEPVVDTGAASAGRWEPRDAWIAAIIGVAVLIVVALLDRRGVAAFALGQPRTIPSMLGASLLALAAVSAWVLGGVAPRGRSCILGNWRPAALLLGLLAIEQATSLHSWAADWIDLRSSLLLALTSVVGATVFAIGSTRLRSTPSLFLWVAGWLTWLAGQASEVVLEGEWQDPASASIEFAGCALIAVSMLLALPPEMQLWRGQRGLGALKRGVERGVEAVSLPSAARGLAAAIGFFAVLGGVLIIFDLEFLGPVQNASNPLQWFDLNQELTFPAYFSGLLLLVMAGLALLVSSMPAVRLGSGTPWVLMALIVSFLAFDEVVDIHGRLQGSAGVEAQVLLAPLILVAAVVGLVLLRRIWPQPVVRGMFLGGAAAWGLAMAIDPSTHPGAPLAFPEEMLEMTGSALFVLALSLLARNGLGPDGPGDPKSTAADPVAQ